MEQQSKNGYKVAILLLASSILIAGLLIGGAIISRAGYSEKAVTPTKNALQEFEQQQNVVRQIPACGV